MSDWKRIESPVSGAKKPKSGQSPVPPAAEQPSKKDTGVKTAASGTEPRHTVERAEEPVEQPVTVPASPETSQQDLPAPAAPLAAGTSESADTALTKADENQGEAGTVPAEDSIGSEEAMVIRSRRYTQKGRRRGRRWYAAPLGLLVLLLAAVGLISLIVTGIGAIRKAQDDTPLRKELESFLSPVMQYCPTAFSDINDNPQDTLLLAAIWKVSKAEQVRMLRENTEESIYPPDEFWRLMIPVSEIEESYRTLYGPDAVPVHRSIDEGVEDFSIEYDEANSCYHVPLMTTVSSNYTPVFDTVKRKGDTVTIRVAYVSNTDVAIDDNGDPITPTPDQASYAQIYTVVKSGDGWALVSIADE